MPKRIFLLALLGLLFLPELHAQRGMDPRAYYREFESENRRIKIKTMRYLEATVTGADPRRVVKFREMVVEQLRESKRALSREGGYQGDSVLFKEYHRGIDLYLKAFTETFGEVEKLEEQMEASFANRLEFYAAQEEAEMQMIDAANIIEAAEEYFAKTYRVDLRRNPEDEQRFRKLDELTLYVRHLNKAFYRVDANFQRLFTAAEQPDQTDSLKIILRSLRKALVASLGDMKDVPRFEGKDWLEEELNDFLQDLSEALDEDIAPLVEQLSNKFLPEDEYEDAQKDLADLREWHNDVRLNYHETLSELTAEYLEDDY